MIHKLLPFLSILIFSISFLCLTATEPTMGDVYYSNDEWFTPYTESDWLLEGAFLGLVLIDWFQTSEFRRDGHREADYFGCMGHYPDQGKINECIAFGAVSHALGTYILRRDIRPLWHGISLTLEGAAVYHNFSKGYGVKISIGGNF